LLRPRLRSAGRLRSQHQRFVLHAPTPDAPAPRAQWPHSCRGARLLAQAWSALDGRHVVLPGHCERRRCRRHRQRHRLLPLRLQGDGRSPDGRSAVSRSLRDARSRGTRKLPHGGVRAFTLVELMVALTGGLIFSVFVFMLTRDVSRFFRNETGLSDATTALLAGYQRLRADVQRAGFLASPNFAKDIGRCPARTPTTGAVNTTNISGGTWATYDLLRDLAIARLDAGATTSTWLTANGLAPDELTLYGNYTTADQYPVRSYSGQNIYLDPNSEELARAGYDSSGTGSAAAAVLQRIFAAGTILRVVSADTGEE